jgi:GNAT superfamily N-acetyltransferase
MGIALRQADSRLRLRLAVRSDLEAILDMHERSIDAAWREIYAPEPIPIARIRERWAVAFEQAQNRWAVLDTGGRIVGATIVASPWLHSLSVDPEYWGTGAAELLHDDAIAAIESHGELDALLRVFAENGRARRFWDKHGWTSLSGSERPHEDPPHPVMLTYVRPIGGTVRRSS